ncbi:MAG: hypothetical protein H6707_08840 [Deltaproteobacteria bacterium]|nr:hypothetical protein [Deltaproteobacteria bacterium]
MRRLTPILTFVACATLAGGALLYGCDSETTSGGEICNNNKDDDGDGKADCADSDCASSAFCKKSDGGAGDGSVSGDGGLVGDGSVSDATSADAFAGNSLQQGVINKINLPKDGSEFQRDWGGKTGKANKLGAILSALGAIPNAGINPQTDVDLQVSQGRVIVLLDLFGKDLSNEASAAVQAHLGFDKDNDPKDNFSGSEDFGISSNSPTNAILTGAISASKLTAGPGDLVLPLPFGGTSPVIVTLKSTKVTATTSANGFVDGIITGAIPASEINTKLGPAVVQLLNDFLSDTNVSEPQKKGIRDFFDSAIVGGNGDGKIQLTEFTDNPVIKLALAADVDTDGDGKAESISAGLGFTTALCKF